MNIWKKIVDKLKKGTWYPFYNTFYERLALEEGTVFADLAEKTGLWDAGAFWELFPEGTFPHVKHVIVTRDEGRAKDIGKPPKASLLRVKRGSLSYYYYLSRAKYIISDGDLPGRFVKKDGQRYMRIWKEGIVREQTWEEKCRMGNSMRNLLAADLLLFGDREEEVSVAGNYHLDRLYNGISVCGKGIGGSVPWNLLFHKGISEGGRSWQGEPCVLLYAGNLDRNGLTTALCGMLRGLHRDKIPYFVSFRENAVASHPQQLSVIPQGVGLYPVASEMNMDILTGIAQMAYLKWGLRYGWIVRRLEQAYQREWRKHFGSTRFCHAVHYNGYEIYMTSLLREAPCKRTIWVHNDMEREIRLKNMQNSYLVEDCYREYDHVVVVSEDLVASTRRLSPESDRIMVIDNIHDYQRVLDRAEEPLCFQQETESSLSLEGLEEVLNSDEEKFINIGRYSMEKGHSRLIHAFEEYWEGHKGTWLIIIGTNGVLYERTKEEAYASSARDHIILIKYMENPMPVLKRCQLLILSSLYEGLGLVLLEADTLGVPVFACDVTGPRGFMKAHGGVLVNDSQQGILEGMELYAKGQIPVMGVDYEEQNQKNIQKCERLFR